MKRFYANQPCADGAMPFSRCPVMGIHGAARGVKKVKPVVSDMDSDDVFGDEFLELLKLEPGKGLVLAY